MRDDEDDPQQRPAPGATGRAADASPAERGANVRMLPHLRMTQAGSATAVLAVAAAVVGVMTYPTSVRPGAGHLWAIMLLVCAAALAAICGYQLYCWTRAMKAWAGRGSAVPSRTSAASFAVHVASYPVLLFALWSGIAGSGYAGWTGTSAVLQTVAVALMLAAQTLAGVQYLRQSGPPGTIPAHLRRMVQQENQRARRLTPRP